MESRSLSAGCPLAVVSLALAAALSPQAARADVVSYVSQGATWRYFRGQTEASSPDPAAWRGAAFPDTSWTEGAAPFGYGDSLPYGVDLGALSPPMRDNYTTLFLRRAFQVGDPSLVTALELSINYDDGVVIWVNGVEVSRLNVGGAPGAPVVFDQLAFGDHEQGVFEVVELPDPGGYLVAGTNVIAVQVFNTSITSSDLMLELELYDPEGIDTTPPLIESMVPAPGATVPRLQRLDVTFTEPVTGVSAGDLLVKGAGASSVSGSGRGPYVFSFPEPTPGTVPMAWGAGHGIQDLATPPNAFAGGAWSVTVDPSASAGDVVISELLALNVSGSADSDGERSDWVEVWNRGGAAVSLAGWSLTDDPGEPQKWVFPAVSLPAGQRVVVWASGKDRRVAGAELHTSFKLSSQGEYLGLFSGFDPGVPVSELSPRYPEQRADVSYGLSSAGALVYFETPTPGAPNSDPTALEGLVAEPVFSKTRGVYSASTQLSLMTTTPGASIYYTLDGSAPSPGTGTLYTGPITVNGTAQKPVVVVRAAAFRSRHLPSRIESHSFIFPTAVRQQSASPTGFPSTWGPAGSTTPADYVMDPLVAGNPAYVDLIDDALRTLPSLSLSTATADFFHPTTGIYSNASQEGLAWERPVSAEWIWPDGSKSAQIDCGVRMQGGSSTSGWKSIKLSMRLLFKDDYGPTRFEFPLFADSTIESFNTLVLDAGLNLTWNHPDHGQRVRSQYVRDQYVSDLQNAAGSLAPHGLQMHVYINGLYWGVYNVHERPDAEFCHDYLGGAEEEYDVLRHVGTELVSGTTQAWNAMMALARAGLGSNSQYEGLQEYLDVTDLSDYMLVNLYCGNDDWAQHNWYAARRRLPGGVFRFFSWDAEHVLKSVSINRLGVNNSNSPAELYTLLRQNAEFRLLFADRAHRLFGTDGPLHVDSASSDWDPAHPERNRPAASYMKRIAEIDAAIACESARWGDVRRPGQPYTRNVEWLAELNSLLAQYFPQRSSVVLGQLQAAGLYPAVDAPLASRPAGVVTPGTTVSLSRPGGTGGTIYYTLDGSDPRSHGSGAVSPTAQTYSSSIVVSDWTRLRARILDAGTWSALTEVVYVIETPLDAVVISEINYHPLGGEIFEFIELHNTGPYTIDLGGTRFTAGVELTLPPYTPIAPDGYVVVAPDAVAFASEYPGVVAAGQYEGSLDNGGERLTLADPGGAVIFSVRYDDTGLWPRSPDGLGWTLVLAEPGGTPIANPDDPAHWRASAKRGGSPGEADPEPLLGGVVINEVLSETSAPFEAAIELFNPSPVGVYVGGWFLSDAGDSPAALKRFRIPDGSVVEAGGYLVLYQAQFGAPGPGGPGFAVPRSGGSVFLSAADELGALGGYVSAVELGGSLPGKSYGRHATSVGVDFTRLWSPTFGVDDPASPEEFRLGAGAANAGPVVGPVVINEVRYHPPASGSEFIELHNITGSDVALHDAARNLGWLIEGISNAADTGPFEFPPGASTPANGYVLVVAGSPTDFRSAHGIPSSVPIFGPFGGGLDNSGETLRLWRPIAPGEGGAGYVPLDLLVYGDQAPWPTSPDGGEPTLERREASSYGNEPLNWGASTEAGGTPGGRNSLSGSTGGNEPPVAAFVANVSSGTVPLTVIFDGADSSDPEGGPLTYAWSFGDGGGDAGVATAHTFATAGDFTVRLTVTDDMGATDSASLVVTALPVVAGDPDRPGDVNLDGRFDISDTITLLGHLFLGAPVALPCGDGTMSDPANRALFSLNGDTTIDISDAVYALNYLFAGGLPPAQGTACLVVRGCPGVCIE